MSFSDKQYGGYIAVGALNPVGFATIWPEFKPNSLEVYLSETNLRRHMQNHDGYIDRVAALNWYGYLIPSILLHPECYLRWGKIGQGEAGVSVLGRIPDGDDNECFLLIGIRVVSASYSRARLNYISTIYPLSRSKFNKHYERATLSWRP